MTTRTIGTTTYSLTYAAENRMTAVSGGGLSASHEMVYDGDGNRVKGTVNSATTVYIGNYFEWTGSTSTMKKYFYASGVRVAMREGSSDPKWLLADHLSSSTITASYTGSRLAELAYEAWGENRYSYGATPTTYRYTGQRQEILLGGVDGLYFYNARWYDSSLGRFLRADTVIPQPGDSQAWDRYAYTLNNPLIFTDPSGHSPKGEDGSPDKPLITFGHKNGICLNIGNIGCSGTLESNSDWIKWNESMLLYEMGQMKEQIEDTYSLIWGWNMSGSTPGNYFTLGQEEVVMLDDGTRATYNYIGEGSSIGAGANMAAYVGVAANVETPDAVITHKSP